MNKEQLQLKLSQIESQIKSFLEKANLELARMEGMKSTYQSLIEELNPNETKEDDIKINES